MERVPPVCGALMRRNGCMVGIQLETGAHLKGATVSVSQGQHMSVSSVAAEQCGAHSEVQGLHPPCRPMKTLETCLQRK